MSAFAVVAVAVTAALAVGALAVALHALATRRPGRPGWRGTTLGYRRRAAVFVLGGIDVALAGVAIALGDGRARFVVDVVGLFGILSVVALVMSAQRRDHPTQ